MPVLFVHGVNVREGPAYEVGRDLSEKFLQKYLSGVVISGKRLSSFKPVFPYWGDLASKFAWNMASLPKGGIDSLGPSLVAQDLRPIVAQVRDSLGDRPQALDQPLLALAKKDLGLAVDVISQVLIVDAGESDSSEIASFIVSAQGYARVNPSPAWLGGATTDAQIIDDLVHSVMNDGLSRPDTLGMSYGFVRNLLSRAAVKLQGAINQASSSAFNRVGDFASTKLVGWTRDSLNGILGRFFGDIFIYFNSRGTKQNPGDIPRRLLRSFEEAVSASSPDEPLVIIGHSLGGVITFDLLSHYTDREVDLLVTVGSQVAHFEELKLFHGSDKAVPSCTKPAATTPGNIKRWINVFDLVDIFSYSAQPIFDRVIDFSYDTMTHTVKAHGAYFEQDRFYERLRDRIDKL
jgi:hypothetical protein